MQHEEIPWDQGNCVGTDPDTWFTGDSHNRYPIQERICKVCRIKTECLEWALENHEVGFWGGQYFRDQGRMTESNVGTEEVHPGDNGDPVPGVWSDAA
jgi:hypothetical protein